MQLPAAQFGWVGLRARYDLRRRVKTALDDRTAVEERRFSINEPRQPPVNVQGLEDLVSFSGRTADFQQTGAAGAPAAPWRRPVPPPLSSSASRFARRAFDGFLYITGTSPSTRPPPTLPFADADNSRHLDGDAGGDC